MTRWNKRDLRGCVKKLSQPVTLSHKRDIRRSVKPLRDRAIVQLLRHDLTTAQVANLLLSDVDVKAQIVKVPVTTCGRVRRVPIEVDDDCAEALAKWLAVRAMVSSGDEMLFVTLHANASKSTPGGKISDRSIRSVMADAFAESY